MQNFITLLESRKDEMRRQVNKSLRDEFNGQIKISFLIEMKERIKKDYPETAQYFETFLDLENVFTYQIMHSGKMHYEYEICNYIVGVHRSNCLLLEEHERRQKEQSADYQKELLETVVQHIKLREFAGSYFANTRFARHEFFHYFPLLYDVYVLSVKGLKIVIENWQKKHPLQEILQSICVKSLAALTMVERYFLNSAYPICRGILELYLKTLVLLQQNDSEKLLNTFERFAKYAVDYSYKEEFSHEFDIIFDNRENKNQTDKLNFLHFGWVDAIDDYHKIIKYNPYKLNSLIKYLLKKLLKEHEGFLLSVEKFYKICHEYVHANIALNKYSIIQYSEISAMLFFVMEHIYRIICGIYNVDSKINGIDILQKTMQDFNNMHKQFENISKEKIELYYKN